MRNWVNHGTGAGGLLLLLLACSGCSSSQIMVTIQATENVNSYNYHGAGGRALDVAVISLGEADLRTLDDTEQIKGQLQGTTDPSSVITPEEFFDRGLKVLIENKIGADAVDVATVGADASVRLYVRRPPASRGGVTGFLLKRDDSEPERRGILVLAHYSGYREDTKNLFNRSLWAPIKSVGNDCTVIAEAQRLKWVK